jgi:hypothetical protein
MPNASLLLLQVHVEGQRVLESGLGAAEDKDVRVRLKLLLDRRVKPFTTRANVRNAQAMHVTRKHAECRPTYRN